MGESDAPFDGTGGVVLRCKICQHDIVRAAYSPFSWVHTDDEVTVIGNVVMEATKYNHNASPDVIDVGETAQQAPKNPPKRSPHPFY